MEFLFQLGGQVVSVEVRKRDEVGVVVSGIIVGGQGRFFCGCDLNVMEVLVMYGYYFIGIGMGLEKRFYFFSFILSEGQKQDQGVLLFDLSLCFGFCVSLGGGWGDCKC